MPETPSPDVMVAIVRELREAHPSVGVKKFVGLAKAAHPHLKFGAREVREALDAIQSGVLPSETKAAKAAKTAKIAQGLGVQKQAGAGRDAVAAKRSAASPSGAARAELLKTLRSARDRDWNTIAKAIKTMTGVITQRGKVQPGQMRDFLSNGALACIAGAISLHIPAAQLQLEAYLVLRYIFDDASLVRHAEPAVNVDTITQICSLVVAGMTKHMQMSDVGLWGAGCLQNIVICSHELKLDVVRLDDCIAVTLQVLAVHLHNEEVQTQALNLLHWLIRKEMAREHYLASKEHCATALKLCKAEISPYAGIPDSRGRNYTQVQVMADLILEQLSKFRPPERSLRASKPAQCSVQQSAQPPALIIPIEAALRRPGESETRLGLKAAIEEDERLFDVRGRETLMCQTLSQAHDGRAWAYSPVLLVRCVKSLSDHDAQQMTTSDVTAAHQILLSIKAAICISILGPPAGTGNGDAYEGLDWMNVFKPAPPTEDRVNFRRTWRSVVVDRLRTCGVPSDRYAVFHNQIMVFGREVGEHQSDIENILTALSIEPSILLDSDQVKIGCERVALEGFVVGNGNLAQMSEDQIIESSHLLPLHQNMRNTAINLQCLLQMNEDRDWDSGAKQHLIEHINEYPALFRQRAEKTRSGEEERAPDVAQEQDAERTAQLNVAYFKDIVEQAFHSVGPLDQRIVESFMLANIGLSHEAFQEKCEQFTPNSKRAEHQPTPDNLSFAHASTRAKELQKPGHAREQLAGYGQEEVAATRQAFADPTNKPQTGYDPDTVAEGRAYVARMQFLLKEAWNYHEQGLTREWMEMTAEDQKVHLRASNYAVPDSPDKPMVKLGHGEQEDMTTFCRYFPDLTVSELSGDGMISLIRRYAETPLSDVMAMDAKHMQNTGAEGLMRSTFIYQILLGQITWYYDHFLTHNNVDALQLLVYGPDKAAHLGERTMRHRALLELEASDAARAKRQADFDAKFGPAVKAARAVEAHSPAPYHVAQPEMQMSVQKSQEDHQEQQRLQDERDRRRSAVIEEDFAKIRIRPKGITSFKRLLVAVTPLGWAEKMGGSGGHHRFERRVLTAGGCEIPQSVTVAATSSDSARAWKNAVNDFNQKTRQKLELCLRE